MADIDAIVQSLADSLRIGDADAFIAYLVPGAIMWHNDTRQDVDTEMQNCIVVSLVDDRVTRIDEYVDPTVAAQLA